MDSTGENRTNGFSATVSQPCDHSLLLADLCEDFSSRVRNGETVDAEEYIAAHPELAEEIRTVFPALLMVNELHVSDADTTSDESLLPDTIGGCSIVRRIGSGGMGVVYEATHPTVSRRVAIKVLTRSGSQGQKFRDRFLREAEATSRLNHPNIVPFLDCGTQDDVVFISMLYVDGISLDHVLERHWIGDDGITPDDSVAEIADGLVAADFRRIASLGADVASALTQAHQLGTIHRDIKPANLILDRNNRVWVTDFGLVKLRDEDDNLSQTGDMIGTPRYMSPEQIRGIADERSDIYALGITLYELAAGQRAWDAVDQNNLLTARKGIEIPHILKINPNVPPTLAAIIMKACSHSPGRRYQTAAKLQHALNHFAHSQSVVDRRSRTRATAERILSRDVLLTIGLVASISAGLLNISGLLKSRTDLTDKIAASSDLSQVVLTNHSPDTGLQLEPVVVDVPEGTTGIAELHLTGSDPDGDPFSWRMLPTRDSSLFVVQRISGHLCFRKTPRFDEPNDADGDNMFQLKICATDAESAVVRVWTEDPDTGTVCAVDPIRSKVTPTTLPHHMLGITTMDGTTFLHVNRSNNGTVALYRSTARPDGNFWTELLESDCKLSPFVTGLASFDGRKFMATRMCRDGTELVTMMLGEDNQFAPGPVRSSQIISACDGISVLDDGDFQLISTTERELSFREAVIIDGEIRGDRLLPTGWTFHGQRVVGLSAWVNRVTGRSESELPVRHVQIRVVR